MAKKPTKTPTASQEAPGAIPSPQDGSGAVWSPAEPGGPYTSSDPVQAAVHGAPTVCQMLAASASSVAKAFPFVRSVAVAVDYHVSGANPDIPGLIWVTANRDPGTSEELIGGVMQTARMLAMQLSALEDRVHALREQSGSLIAQIDRHHNENVLTQFAQEMHDTLFKDFPIEEARADDRVADRGEEVDVTLPAYHQIETDVAWDLYKEIEAALAEKGRSQ